MVQSNEELKKWVLARRQEGYSNESIKRAMLKAGYSEGFIEEALKTPATKRQTRYFEKKQIILIPALIVILLILFIIIKPYLVIKKTEAPRITSDSSLNNIIFNSIRKSFWKECNVDIEDSLINVVHIKKNGLDYQISCEYGDSYQNAYLIDMSPETNVYMGQIRKCDVETAQEIDQAMNSGADDCRVPSYNPQLMMSLNLTDYYLFSMVCIFEEVTPEYIDFLQTKVTCLKNLEPMIGKRIGRGRVVGIIDSNTNSVFY